MALAVLLLGAFLSRWLLYRGMAAFVTNDSWDYVLAARDIAQDFDFSGKGLRDWRMPGYPLLLALCLLFEPSLRSDHIVLLQATLGLATALLGYWSGRLLHSQPVAIGMAAFLAVNPIYLLFEHTIMTETLSIFALMGFIVAVLWACNRPERSLVGGAGVGLLYACCVLTRANLLIFCSIMLVCPPLFWRRIADAPRTTPLSISLRFSLAVLVVGLLSIGPWIYRNHALYGDFALAENLDRGLLVYKAMYGAIDTSLPGMATVAKKVGTAEVNYGWLQRLNGAYPTSEAESVARALWWEQVATHPQAFASDVGQSALGVSGLRYASGGDLAAVHLWLNLVVDRVAFDSHNRDLDGFQGFRYVPAEQPNASPRVLRRLGWLYLDFARPVLNLTLVALLIVCIWARSGRGRAAATPRDVLVTVLVTAHAASTLTHVGTLAVNDRFASSFDLVSFFIVLLLLDALQRATLTRLSSVR